MTNPNFWKDAYKSLWDKTSKKEEALKELIEKETGLVMLPFGLGAETTEYISGSALDNNQEKGAPDYRIKNTNIFIEVTGPNSDKTLPQYGFWLRPDKLRYAKNHLDEADEIFALYFPSVSEWYIIHATKEFFDDVKIQSKNGTDYNKVSPIIRGNKEHYIEIKYKNKFVKDLQYLIEYLLDF